MKSVPFEPGWQGGLLQGAVRCKVSFYFFHMPKSSGDEDARAVFTSGSFQAGGWEGVCLDIDPWSRETRIEKTVGFIVYTIDKPGWKGPCCICVLKLHAWCGPVTQTVTRSTSSTSHRIDLLDDQEQRLTAFYKRYEKRVEGWKVETDGRPSPRATWRLVLLLNRPV